MLYLTNDDTKLVNPKFFIITKANSGNMTEQDLQKETVQLLKEISSKLDTAQDSWADRNLQINLGKIQADIQVYLTLYIGFFAAFLSFGIYTNGMVNSMIDTNPMKSAFSGANALAFLVLIPITLISGILIARKRRQLDEINPY